MQFVGLIVIGAGFLMRSRASVQRKFNVTHTQAIAAESKRRLEQFNAAAAAAQGNAAALRDTIALANRLELTDADVGYGVIEELAAQSSLLDFQSSIATNRGNLEEIAGCERVVGDKACYFTAEKVVYDKRGDDDPTGTLYLTGEGSLFVAPTFTHITPWAKVVSITRDGRALRVQRRDRQTPTEFVFASKSEAAVGTHVATVLWSK